MQRSLEKDDKKDTGIGRKPGSNAPVPHQFSDWADL